MGRTTKGTLLKIEAAVQRSDRDLCLTCAHLFRARSAQDNREIRQCGAFGHSFALQFKVNSYSDPTELSLRDMKEIAWNITTTNKGKIGFRIEPPKRKSEDDMGRYDL